MGSYKQRAKEYREKGFMQLIGTKDKDFVVKCERYIIDDLINELGNIISLSEFKVSIEHNNRRKYKTRYIIDVKSQ